MRTPKHTEQNVHLLSEEITDSMPQDIIIQAFYEDQYDYYKDNKEAFLTDWEDYAMGDKLASYAVEDEVE
jgi:CTP:phosphocholine cytidylyltransferase-like protein